MTVIRSTVLNINKPLHWTSRDVLNKLQNYYPSVKFGHAGTLDPLATGVLLVLVGDFTKKQDYFMGLKKIYKTRIFFGLSSPTKDLEGPFTSTKSTFKCTKSSFQNEITNFLEKQLGLNKQIVPFYSAVKVNGKELYKHARNGKEIENLPTKEVEMLDYSILDMHVSNKKNLNVELLNKKNIHDEKLNYLCKNASYLDLVIKTSKGFYVRSLASDLGIYLNTDALIGTLERSAVGEYTIEKSIKLDFFKTKPNIIT